MVAKKILEELNFRTKEAADGQEALDAYMKTMPDDGVLFLGGAETVLGVTDKFQPLPGQRGVYGLTRNA
jgi:chemotaxis methyl-accepting protein methylase